MRILHIVPSLAPETGGPAISVLRICSATAMAGNEVNVFSTGWPKDRSAIPGHILEHYSKYLTIKLFPTEPSPFKSRLPHSPLLVTAVARELNNFDMIVSHSLWNPLITFSMAQLRKANVIYCVMPHGMLDPLVFQRNSWKKVPWAFLWDRENIEKASLIIFNTVGEEEKGLNCGWHLRRTFLLPHLVEVSSWKSLPARSVFESLFPKVRGCEVILFVGRINWVKNLDKLIDALSMVRQARPSAMLVCVGPDSDGYQFTLEQRAYRKGLNNHILFTGMLAGDHLKAAYGRGDVFAFVSQKENFGLAAADALASGLPVVLSEGVDLGKDWVSEGPIRRVNPTPPEIAKAIIELLERSARVGLPDSDAQALAEREWGANRILALIGTYRSLFLDKKNSRLDERTYALKTSKL
ncbi:MAG: glycosyltransferase [Deltaproteobacteria bacterium]|nr:glycosyltransferase [Deltaproteobacteria bacterium]